MPAIFFEQNIGPGDRDPQLSEIRPFDQPGSRSAAGPVEQSGL